MSCFESVSTLPDGLEMITSIYLVHKVYGKKNTYNESPKIPFIQRFKKCETCSYSANVRERPFV